MTAAMLQPACMAVLFLLFLRVPVANLPWDAADLIRHVFGIRANISGMKL